MKVTKNAKFQERNGFHRGGTEYAEIFSNSPLHALSASAVNIRNLRGRSRAS
jgi:hypothetical protein